MQYSFHQIMHGSSTRMYLFSSHTMDGMVADSTTGSNFYIAQYGVQIMQAPDTCIVDTCIVFHPVGTLLRCMINKRAIASRLVKFWIAYQQQKFSEEGLALLILIWCSRKMVSRHFQALGSIPSHQWNFFILKTIRSASSCFHSKRVF